MLKIVFQTNPYIQNQKSITPVIIDDIYGFIALQFLFGYYRLPRTHMYLSSDIDISVNVVSQTMTRDQYFQILPNIHLNDSLSTPANNKDEMYKLRPFISCLNKIFKKFILGTQIQSIDENMVFFKDRSTLNHTTQKNCCYDRNGECKSLIMKCRFKLWYRANIS